MLLPTKSQTEQEKIRQLCLSAGADLAGFAPVKRFSESPKGFHPTDLLPDAHTVIVLACRFAREAAFAEPPLYTAMRNESVKHINEIASVVAKALHQRGAKSKTVSSINTTKHEGRSFGRLSLKHAGQLAGLGRIGHNYLLTHPQFGNMIWLAGVVTTMELPGDPIIREDFCGKCNHCISQCPAGALNKPLFDQQSCRR